ncbi:hypothetical protein PFISCL1PPCAC_20793, partial [Pristionchus fissidentatus]
TVTFFSFSTRSIVHSCCCCYRLHLLLFSIFHLIRTQQQHFVVILTSDDDSLRKILSLCHIFAIIRVGGRREKTGLHREYVGITHKMRQNVGGD